MTAVKSEAVPTVSPCTITMLPEGSETEVRMPEQYGGGGGGGGSIRSLHYDRQIDGKVGSVGRPY